MKARPASSDHLFMSFEADRDGAGRPTTAAIPTLLPATANGRKYRRGIGAVAFWHGMGLALVAIVATLITVAVAASPGGLNDPDSFLPGWIVPALFAFAGAGLLLTSFVIAMLVMALVAPRVIRHDVAAHGLLVSLASAFLAVPTLWIVLHLPLVLAPG